MMPDPELAGIPAEEFEMGPLQSTMVDFHSWGKEQSLSVATLNVQHLFTHWEFVIQLLEQHVAHIIIVQEHKVAAHSR